MSQDIVREVTFFSHSFLLGLGITLFYDIFLLMRKLVAHNLLFISLEDMIYWIACAIGVFYVLYEENNGILRWFAVLGAAAGMLAYKKTVGTFLIDIMSTIIRRIFRVLLRLSNFLLRPLRFLGHKIRHILGISGRRGRKFGKTVKKKLTQGLKLLKITLCKHNSDT